MSLGGYNQNWIPSTKQREKIVEIEVEKLVEVVVEKIIIDPHTEKRVMEALYEEVLCIELLQKELRVCNDILDDLIWEARTHE